MAKLQDWLERLRTARKPPPKKVDLRGLRIPLVALSGAVLAFLFDKDRGRRRRVLVRDQVVGRTNDLRDWLDGSRKNVGNWTQGLIAETKGRLKDEAVDDMTLIARVRSEIGRVASHPKMIDVTANNGHVTLNGYILTDEIRRLLRTVSRVRGVHALTNELQSVASGAEMDRFAGMMGTLPQPSRTTALSANPMPTALSEPIDTTSPSETSRPAGWSMIGETEMTQNKPPYPAEDASSLSKPLVEPEHNILIKVREGMHVHDPHDKHVGSVAEVYFGSAASKEERERGTGAASIGHPEMRDDSLIDNIAEVFDPNDLPEVVRNRLLHGGYIRIDTAGLFTADRFATPDQIAGVTGDTVHLAVASDKLFGE
jgi:hypothetical protein